MWQVGMAHGMAHILRLSQIATGIQFQLSVNTSQDKYNLVINPIQAILGFINDSFTFHKRYLNRPDSSITHRVKKPQDGGFEPENNY